MKQTFFMLAAMLLMSMGAFAQSNEPLEGDVNKDGKVDVADIVKVIDIMQNGGGVGGQTKCYWYVGTTKPTSLSQCEIISEYPTEDYIYTNNSGTKAHIFVLTNNDKNVTFVNPELYLEVDQKEVDTVTIANYKIFETAVGIANTGSIIIRIS